MLSIKLTADDVAALKAICAFCANADRSTPAADRAYLATLDAMKAALLETALAAWTGWPSSRLSDEIERWRPAYRVVRTRAGFKAFRWVCARGAYASRAIAAGLTEREADAYRSLIRC